MRAQEQQAFLAGGGAMGDLIGSKDWAGTPLGAIDAWPAGLKTLLATLLRARHPMLLWWGPQLVQFYNDAFVPSFGIGKHPAALGQPGRESWAEVWPIVGAQIEDVVARGASIWSEDALVPILRNGRIEEVHWTYGYSPVVDDQGKIAGVLIVCNETTSRVIAERRLGVVRMLVEKTAECVDSSSVVNAMYEAAAAATYDIPFAATYLVEDATGVTRTECSANLTGPLIDSLDALLSEHATRSMHSGSTPAALLELPSPFPGGAWPEPASKVFVLPSKSRRGLLFTFGVSPRLQFDATYRSFFEHIVEQVEIAFERARAVQSQTGIENERRNLLLQAPMPTALFIGPRHVFELANAPYEQMVGRKVVGKTYLEAFPELEGTALPGILDAVYATGKPFVAPESLVRLDRNGDGVLEDGYFRFNLEALRDTDGVVYGMMAVAFDITEQVNARLELERRIAEARAANEQLAQLSRQLEAASHAKDEFLATVSHELRTPLNAILGWSHLVSNDSHPDRIKKGLSIIERNARAQAQLIEDLLDVSRIISGKVRMSMKRVDLASVARAAVEAAQPSADAKGVRLNVSLEPHIGEIVADEDRIQQVIWNLLSNGVKFTPTGGEVTLHLTRGASRVGITVQDTGQGISEALLPRVFDRFRQGDSSTTRAFGGLGLGLAIVRHLVELHGGIVSARSAGEGKGATFEVELPVHAVQVTSQHGPLVQLGESDTASSAPPARRLAGAHVLVVDDEDDARDLVATVLERAGASVSQASSVSAAIELLSGGSVAVIVSDIGMPGEDGYSFLKRVRSAERGSPARSVPALALTAYARGEDRDNALAAGFQEHVAKPIDPTKLVDVVAALIRA